METILARYIMVFQITPWMYLIVQTVIKVNCLGADLNQGMVPKENTFLILFINQNVFFLSLTKQTYDISFIALTDITLLLF